MTWEKKAQKKAEKIPTDDDQKSFHSSPDKKFTQGLACFSSTVYIEAISLRLAVESCRCDNLENLKILSFIHLLKIFGEFKCTEQLNNIYKFTTYFLII